MPHYDPRWLQYAKDTRFKLQDNIVCDLWYALDDVVQDVELLKEVVRLVNARGKSPQFKFGKPLHFHGYTIKFEKVEMMALMGEYKE